MNKYIAECFGTAVLVLVGCGAAVIAGDQLGLLGVALAFGLAVMAMVYTIGSVSGCHINPAISLAMWMRGKLATGETAWYIIAQIVWASLGAFILMNIASVPWDLAANGIMSGYNTMSVALAEAIFTALFILVIFGATSKNWAGNLAGVVIGLTLSMCIMVLGPISNASLNPARSLGPALVGGGDALQQSLLFVVAPVVGALLAVLIWKYLMGRED